MADGPKRFVRKDGVVNESWGVARTVHNPHPADCECQRCRGFEPGNELSMRHGAYSVVQLAPRAQEVADSIRDTMVAEELWRDSFAPAVAACAVVLVRLERATAALTHAEDILEAGGASPLAAYLGADGTDTLGKLREDSRRWANSAKGYLSELGLTPRSLAAIARDTGLARSTRASAAIRALDRHLTELPVVEVDAVEDDDGRREDET